MKNSPRRPDCLRHDLEKERKLAAKMSASTREERTELFKTRHLKHFVRVPYHPRLTYRKTAFGIGISNQRSPGGVSPDNFEIIIHDGYHRDLPPDGCADFALRHQFLDYLHPDDFTLHFDLAHPIQKNTAPSPSSPPLSSAALSF